MSYGKFFEVDKQNYLLEISDEYVYIAKQIKEDDFTQIYEGNYKDIFWEQELEELEKLNYEEQLYAILIYCLNGKYINRVELYQKYIYEMMESHTKEEILSNSNNELSIYKAYYPLDSKGENFKRVTESLIYRDIK